MVTRNTNLCFIAVSRLDVVHDVDVDIVKNDVDTAIRGTLLLIHDVSEDHSGLS